MQVIDNYVSDINDYVNDIDDYVSVIDDVVNDIDDYVSDTDDFVNVICLTFKVIIYAAAMSDLVTIKTFSYSTELAVIRARLESEGIECFVKDELTAQVNPFYSNA